jgi:hypothetical protein
MARSVLRQIRVASKDELTDRIQRYIEFCNEAPLVPKWHTASAANRSHSPPDSTRQFANGVLPWWDAKAAGYVGAALH